MNTPELIEQLELILHDHPEATNLDIRANGLDIFAVQLRQEDPTSFVDIELYRPYALTK
jgi:hypothetical protein